MYTSIARRTLLILTVSSVVGCGDDDGNGEDGSTGSTADGTSQDGSDPDGSTGDGGGSGTGSTSDDSTASSAGTDSTSETSSTGGGTGSSDGCDYDPACGTVPAGMVCVPAGTFEMGSEAGDEDEIPVRRVCMPTYYIDETEVTVLQYEDCVTSGDCSAPDTGEECNWQVAGREDHPINCVDWFQATEYCEWAGKRLPTEAQWEKAARGTDARTYPWGEETPTCEYAVMDDGGDGCGNWSTMPVGSKSPAGDSPFGVKDMTGNAWEWCADWYVDVYDAQDTDDPQGPASGEYRTVRGGCWYHRLADALRTPRRGLDFPTRRTDVFGFRCAKTPDP